MHTPTKSLGSYFQPSLLDQSFYHMQETSILVKVLRILNYSKNIQINDPPKAQPPSDQGGCDNFIFAGGLRLCSLMSLGQDKHWGDCRSEFQSCLYHLGALHLAPQASSFLRMTCPAQKDAMTVVLCPGHKESSTNNFNYYKRK